MLKNNKRAYYHDVITHGLPRSDAGEPLPAQLLGNGVRFGKPEPTPADAGDIFVAGEGIETMLALKLVLSSLPVIAGLSANHLAALGLPPAPALRRLYVAPDNDAAGLKAATRLHERGKALGIDVRELVPVHGDFNLDLYRLGADRMRVHLADQLVPSDREHFLPEDRRSDPWR